MVFCENLNFAANILKVSTLHVKWQSCSSLKVEGDIDVCMKQWYVIEILIAESIAHIEIHLYVRNVYGDMTVSVNAVKGGLGMSVMVVVV
jgi:hypothetical protein